MYSIFTKPMFTKPQPLLYKDLVLFGGAFLLAAFSLLTTVGLPYQGEEAVYTITSMEMAFQQEWLVPTLYGKNYARPPLLNWFMIPFASSLGWEQVLVAARLLTVFATLATSSVLIWFVQKLFLNRTLSFLTALIFLSGDVLFRRGWLAYADPLFSLWVFSAIACLWVATQEKQFRYLSFAVLLLVASYLTKAVTGYIFYAVTFFVLFLKMDKSARQFLLSFRSIVLHALALLFPLIWNYFLSDGAHGTGMLNDVLVKLNVNYFKAYLIKILFYPVDILARWLPVSALVLYFVAQAKNRHACVSAIKNPSIMIAAAILALNFLPYWLAPVTHMRYIMPLYPLFALVLAFLIMQMGKQCVKTVLVWLVLAIIARYLMGWFGFSYYEQRYRGDYQATAKDILRITQDQPLFVIDDSATGLSVVAHIDVLQRPRFLTKPPEHFEKGFLISKTPDVSNTTLVKAYSLGHHSLYLLRAK